MNNTWFIMRLISCFNNRTKDMRSYSKEMESLQELYAQAIRIQCKENTYWCVMTIDDFIENVKVGCFIDYDGTGYFADYDGNKHECVCCDVDWLKKHRKDYSFVFWYNK